MSAPGSLSEELRRFRDALEAVTSQEDESDEAVERLRDAAESLIDGIEEESGRTTELALRAKRAIGPPVDGSVLDDLGTFVATAAPLNEQRLAVYAAARAVHDDHTVVDRINVESIVDGVFELESEYDDVAEDVETRISEAESAYDEDGGTDFNDPSRGAPRPSSARLEWYSDPHNPGLLRVENEALYTLYLENAGTEPSDELRVIASFDDLSHFEAGFLAEVPEEAVTLSPRADFTDDSPERASEDPDAEEDPDTEEDDETAVPSIEETERSLDLGSIGAEEGAVFGVYAVPTEAGVDQLHVAVQRTEDPTSEEWETVADGSVSMQAFSDDGVGARAAEILDPTEERRSGESNDIESDDERDDGESDDTNVIDFSTRDAAAVGGAGIVTAGGYLAYRRFNSGGDTTDETDPEE